VFNDVGEFEAIAKVAAVMQPGQTMIYHAWEPYQFKRHRGSQEPVPAPWKPAQLAGGYGQLHYRPVYNAPGHTPRGQRVQIERV
jgi:ethylbenzene hydroxylase subunit alpha/complex iron-sulfur molybdoenzyme family reductase subunit alpha